MVAAVLNQSGLSPAQLTRIGVAIGPGSFAGSRVGVAFARGLALATGADAVGVSNLAVIAAMTDPHSQRDVAVVHDAKRGDLVVQAFSRGAPLADPVRLDANHARQWLSDRLDKGAGVTGSGAAQLMAELQPDWQDDVFTGGPDLAPCTLLDLAERERPAAPSPFYARPPDAKLPGGITPP